MTTLKGSKTVVFIYTLVILFFLIINYFFNIRFEANDDILMSLIASGKYSGTPDAHLVFSNIIYGYINTFFYTLLPSIEWYTILSITTLVISFSELCSFILDSKLTKVLKGSFIIFLASLFFFVSLKLQFTYTAGFTGIAGICLLYSHKTRFKTILGIALIILSSLIRFEACMLVLLITMPTVLLNGIHPLKNTNFKLLMLTLSCIAGCKIINDVTYANEDQWAYYLEFNTARGLIHDNPNVSKIKDELPANISASDYELFSQMFADQDKMNLNVINELLYTLKDVPLTLKFENLATLLSPYYYVWMALMLIITLLLINKNNHKEQWIPFIIFLVLLASLGFISLEHTVKNRIFLTAIGAYLFIQIIFINKLRISTIKQYCISAVILLCSFIVNNRAIAMYNYDGEHFPEIYNEQHKLLDSYLNNTSKKIVSYKANLKIDYVNPFQISENHHEQQIFFSGWLMHIPFNKHHFNSFDFFKEGHGLFISKEDYASIKDVLIKNLGENTSSKITSNIISESTHDYIIEFTWK